MDCFYSAWSTKHPEGFSDANIAALRRLAPTLGLAAKNSSLTRIAGTLVDVYLGHDAGRMVLQGRIQRGIADRIEAVLWFSDLRSFTAITDTARPVEIIPLLNDYADAVITAIHQAGGDVLKLIGDGTLAIFRADDRGTACENALRAEADMRRRVAELNERRKAEERPTTSVYVGLHVGAVFYGNIGSVDRLDFTVVGPAVNETSRIASMCRSVDRPLLISSAFAVGPAGKGAPPSRVGRAFRSSRRRPRAGPLHARPRASLTRRAVPGFSPERARRWCWPHDVRGKNSAPRLARIARQCLRCGQE